MTSPSQFHSTLHSNGVAEVVIDRAPVNALNAAGWHGLAAEIASLGEREAVRVIVIRAENRGFCAGVDIKELAANDKLIVSVNAGNYATFKAVHLNKVPVIAAVHGFVLGGGIGICGAADIVIAADDASFGLPEVDRGAMGGAAHLQRMFGVQKTRYLFFTGEMIGAQEAHRLGAVERVVPRAQLRETAMAIAERIAAKSPAMIRIAKEALTGIEPANLEDQYRWEQGFTLQAYMSPDSAATRAAFVDKREAKF
ncbi:enoyl-CoA hydratase family protein [Rhodoferax lacus]|uniref:Enoyl-CoA hydratase family protein n=1 Tax=Rhodoferax lacus TaxID=2184758 RepID=A0A3E1R6M2_9BURK|nr:enoyl-CoA hydratase family protein [Rhodoferax lacus]RFO94994.1 enoyl-CoA hydratase family protein [Rhodoferax lacus]